MKSTTQDSRNRILASAEKIFAQKGFDGARVDEIARTAGVNKALIYYYFSGKEEILHTLFDEFIREVSGFFLEIARGGFAFESSETSETMERYRNYLISRKDLLKIMMIESLKGSTLDPPIFSLIDFSKFTNMNEDKVMDDLKTRGFKLDEERDQRMVTEFFTGVLPDVCYIIFKDQWMDHFTLASDKLDRLYGKAIDMTHKAHYNSK